MRAKRTVLLPCLALLLMLAISADAWAAQGERPEAPPGVAAFGPLPAPPSVPWWRLLWGTGVVVGLMCLGVLAAKKLNGGLPLNRGRHMEVLEVRPAGRKVQLLLVRVGDRVILFACCGSSVTRLAELAADELPELGSPEAQAQPLSFRSLFRKLAGGQA
jgi:flagellar biogenesis protein FliO